MFKDFKTIGGKLASAEPWVIIALVMAVVLAGYYAVLGARYWKASSDAPILNSRVQSLNRILGTASSEDQDLNALLMEKEIGLEAVTNAFIYGQSDDLISIASEEARKASISLLVVSVDAPGNQVIDGITFKAQSLNLTIQGESKDIFKFVAQLYERVPILRVTSLRMAELDDNPSAQIGLQALLDPSEATESEASE